MKPFNVEVIKLQNKYILRHAFIFNVLVVAIKSKLMNVMTDVAR